MLGDGVDSKRLIINHVNEAESCHCIHGVGSQLKTFGLVSQFSERATSFT